MPKTISWSPRSKGLTGLDVKVEMLGCPDPVSPRYYGFTGRHHGQTGCLNYAIKPVTKEHIESVIHYTKKECEECQIGIDKVICVRHPEGSSRYIITEHIIGACPYCDYEEV